MSVALPMGAFAWPCQPLDLSHDGFAQPFIAVGSPPGSTSTEINLNLLPRGTRVRVTGNNRCKRELIGVEAIIRRATGLGGWHTAVLPNGEEIKLQRNALEVIELGTEESQESSDEEEPQVRSLQRIEILDRPRIRRPPRSLSPVPDMFKPAPSRPSSGGSGSGSGSGSSGRYHPYSYNHHISIHPSSADLVNLRKLETASLRRYRRVHQLAEVDPAAPRDELVHAVNNHFRNQVVVDESGTLLAFCTALRRRSSSGTGSGSDA